VGWNPIKPNRNIVGKVLSLCGKPYEKGMGVHAVSELVYPIRPEHKRFVALAGIDDDTKGRGSVTFEVYVDGRMVYETPILRARQQWHIDVPLAPGAKTLRLVLTVGPDDYNYDWGDWLNAGFVTGK
jgi:alpha-galactosidase